MTQIPADSLHPDGKAWHMSGSKQVLPSTLRKAYREYTVLHFNSQCLHSRRWMIMPSVKRSTFLELDVEGVSKAQVFSLLYATLRNRMAWDSTPMRMGLKFAGQRTSAHC